MWAFARDYLAELRRCSDGDHDVFMFCYDFRVRPGSGDEFAREFDAWDQSELNWFHEDPDQVQEGVLYRDDVDPDHFLLIGIWNGRESHRRARARLEQDTPAWLTAYLEDGSRSFRPSYFSIAA